MSVYAVAGAKIYIGGVLPAEAGAMVAGDFTSQTWVEIDGWETMGEFGDSAEVIRTQLINRGRVIKQKGPRDAGTMQNTFVVVPGDDGQEDLRQAEATQNEYAFRIVWDDKPNSNVGSSATTQYFCALVNGARTAGGGAATARKFTTILDINSNIVTVDAVAA